MTSRALMLDYVARIAYWIMLAASVWILLRGHNAPGGGFIAGLMAVSATALLAIVYGVDSARRRLPLRPPALLAAMGLLLALVSGLPGLWHGAPYLTHQWSTLELGVTSLKLSTVIVFDLGVYAAVWGAITQFIFNLLADQGDEA
jgi:multicomponent Na+:H+ antiporter subunit B